MRLETRIPIPGLEVRATRPSTESICMYVWRLGSELKEEGRRRGSCPRCRRPPPPPPPPPLPSPLGAPERPTDRSYASHPSMSSELLLSSVSLPLPLLSLSLSLPVVHQFVCRSHTTFRRRPKERANESERTHDELAEGNCEVERERGERRDDDMQR